MGVKSTKRLTRSEAEARYRELGVRRHASLLREDLEGVIKDADIGKPYLRNSAIDELSEREIIEVYLHVEVAIRKTDWLSEIKHLLVDLSDTELENALERLNDDVNHGEGFENYCIIPSRDD